MIDIAFSTGKEATDEELAALLNLPIKKIKAIKTRIYETQTIKEAIEDSK